jgi:hypothetical protein
LDDDKTMLISYFFSIGTGAAVSTDVTNADKNSPHFLRIIEWLSPGTIRTSAAGKTPAR